MAFGKIDLNDSVVSPFFVISAAVAVSLVDFTIWGVDFSSPLLSFGSVTISIAKAISIMALGTAFITNRPSFGKMGGVETWIALTTIGLVLFPPFFPILDSVLQHTSAALVSVIIQAGGFYSLSYLG